MPVADELAALRARGTVKATSSAISSKQTNYVYTTPQQQEVIRKQKAKQEKAAREEAEKSLRKHNAGGINDLWYKKLRELKARKKAGARSAWKKKDKADGDHEDEGDKYDEEDVGLEVDMLPDHLVKALKAKYETENAEEALSKALVEEEEGRGSILSEVMADWDANEEDKAAEHIDNVSTGVGEEVKETDCGVDEEVKKTDIEDDTPDTQHEDIVDNKEQIEIPAPIEENEPKNANALTESKESTPEIEALSVDEPEEGPTGGKPVEELKDEEPVEEVRTKIEQLSIDDIESKSFDEEKKTESLPESTDTEQEQVELEDAESNPPIIDETKDVTSITIQQPKLLYNVHDKYFSTYDNTAKAEEFINLLDTNQRGALDEEQTIEIKEQLVALQDQIKDLMANW